MHTSPNDTTDTPLRCHPRRSGWVIAALASLLLLATACTPSTDTAVQADASSVAPEVVASPTPSLVPGEAPETDGPDPTPEPTASPEPVPTPNPIVAADTELPPAPIGFETVASAQAAGPQPVAIAIEDIGVRNADVIPVGVNAEDLTFEVPPADQVGWYEFGPTPGETGSSVLAAHIAYNGVDGVFRYLADVEVGSVVIVDFDDGTSQRFRIETVTDYFKEELPDSLFARDGRQQLALITCGGAFNEQLDSYESNTVAVAVPIDV